MLIIPPLEICDPNFITKGLRQWVIDHKSGYHRRAADWDLNRRHGEMIDKLFVEGITTNADQLAFASQNAISVNAVRSHFRRRRGQVDRIQHFVSIKIKQDMAAWLGKKNQPISKDSEEPFQVQAKVGVSAEPFSVPKVFRFTPPPVGTDKVSFSQIVPWTMQQELEREEQVEEIAIFLKSKAVFGREWYPAMPTSDDDDHLDMPDLFNVA